MTILKSGQQQGHAETRDSTLRAPIPLRATNWTAEGVRVFEGRLEALKDGKAQICLDQPLPIGTEIEIFMELKDHRNREIRFRYNCEIASRVSRRWYEVDVSFKDCGGISGKDAREVLADLFPG